jgi:hypothetical protein
MNDPRERSEQIKQIKQAAWQYAFNRWRSALPGLARAAPLFAMIVAVSAATGATLGWAQRHGGVWHWAAPVVMLALIVVSFFWFAWARFRPLRWWLLPTALVVWCGLALGVGRLSAASSLRLVTLVSALGAMVLASILCGWLMLAGGWQDRMRRDARWIQQDAGVVVEEPILTKPRWWWPFALVPGVAWALGTMWLSFMADARLQPLVFAAGWTAAQIAAYLVMHRIPKSGWSPAHLVSSVLYCCYAAAVAAGMPQPWAGATGLWAWDARVVGPLVPLTAIQMAARELYSKRQFRRLQRLLAEGAEEAVAHGAD